MTTAERVRSLLLAANDILTVACDDLKEKPLNLPAGDPVSWSVYDIRMALLKLHEQLFRMEPPKPAGPPDSEDAA